MAANVPTRFELQMRKIFTNSNIKAAELDFVKLTEKGYCSITSVLGAIRNQDKDFFTRMGIKEDHLNHFLSLNVTLNSLVKWSDVLNQDEKEYIMNMFDLQKKRSGFDILETCFIEQLTEGNDESDYNDENAVMPYFPYKLIEYEPDSILSTHTKYSLKPGGLVSLVSWPNFQNSFQNFLNSKNTPNAPLRKFYSGPSKRPVVEVGKKVDVAHLLRNSISDTILRFYKHKKIKLSQKHSLAFGRPDFCILQGGHARIVIECKHPKHVLPRTKADMIRIFNEQMNEGTTLETARAVNQIVNYMIDNKVRRGILTFLEGSVAFESNVKKSGHIFIKVSDMLTSNRFLKLVAFLIDPWHHINRREGVQRGRRRMEETKTPRPLHSSVTCRLLKRHGVLVRRFVKSRHEQRHIR